LTAVALLTLVVACSTTGASAGTPTTVPPEVVSTAGDEATDHEETTTTETMDIEPSPLEAFLGFGGDRFTEPSEEELAKQAEVQRLTVECMRAEGFEYVAEDPGYDPIGLGELWALPADEYASRYGYGISTIDVDELLDEARANDPNEAIMDSLSPTAQRAYFEALNGAATAASKWGEPIPEDADERPGCRPAAETQVYGNQEKVGPPPEFDALREEMDTLESRVMNDGRVAAAEATWAECMAEIGYPEYDRPGDPEKDITERLWAVYGVELPEELLSEFDARRPKESRVPMPMPRTDNEPDQLALEELQSEEIAIALADLSCRSDYEATVTAVRSEIEQAFIEDNRAQLERFRESISIQADEDQ
jgi:hypothetical protein